METKAAGGGGAREYRDRLDRVVRRQTAGFAAGARVTTDTEYDALGRIARQSIPYYAAAPATRAWTTYSYDLLGRVITTTLPDYATDSNDAVTVNSVITTAYTGFTTTTTNGKGQAQAEVRNALGEVIRATDANNTPLAHAYDAWGQVIRTTTGSGAGVTVRRAYDPRGRRIRETDPDRGVTRYRYNGFDERVGKTDAVGNRHTWVYDGLGRLKTRYELPATGDPVVTDWGYDGTEHGLGQLWAVTTETRDRHTDALRHRYQRVHSYDRYGRPDREDITLTGQATYYSRQTYDG